MTIDHDAIAARVRRDRKAGTPGPWKCGKNNPTRVTREGRYIANFDPLHSNAPKCEMDARRAAHMPDLEDAYLDLYDEVAILRANLHHVIQERDATFALMLARAKAAEAERDRVAAEWAETSQRNYQRAKAAEARVAKLVEAYDATNPLRTAAMHHADCKCLRCEVDDARQTLKGDDQ